MDTLLAPTPTSASFAARVSGPLPIALREAAARTSYEAFCDEYAPTAGPLRLGTWTCAGGPRGPQACSYEATLAVGDRIVTAQAAACGPVAALTAMLHERGVAVEVNAFHQQRVGDDTATFVRGSDHRGSRWAMGLSGDPVQSALRAVIACANRLQDE
jgi:hypothetical protein